MNILKKLDKNMKILNISNCGFRGVLDLIDFEYLQELYCANNEISEIKNFPYTIKYIDCSFNKFTEIIVPFNNKILCSNNNISKIYYFTNAKITKYPRTLKKMIFADNYNYQINNLSASLLKLYLSANFNHIINNLPNSFSHK